MKILLITSALLIFTILACGKMKKGAIGNDELCGGVEPPLSVVPFWDVPLSQARSIALRRVRTSEGYGTNTSFIALITEDEMNDESVIEGLGFDRKKDAKTWYDSYFGIVVKSHSKDAKELIQQYSIQGFPATIKESRSVDGTEIFSEVWYGYLPQVSGSNEIDARPIIRKMFDKYNAGDRDKNLLIQLRDHLELLELNSEAQEQLHWELTNEYLNQFTREELGEYPGYRLLKKELKDVRMDAMQVLLMEREHYNEKFRKIAEDKKLKNGAKRDADWITEQAILASFQKAGKEGDGELYLAAQAVKEQYKPGYMTKYIAKSILEYQIKKGVDKNIREAALQYFGLNKNWYSTDPALLEAAASAINKTGRDTAEWEQAERWIARVIEKFPNPTRYRLQVDLLQKLDRQKEVKNTLARIHGFKKDFLEFKNFYPFLSGTPELQDNDITKADYKKLEGIPGKYKTYYEYIARESSIYKKGQIIEPIALLKQNENSVELLTRVHLMTGSILPVSHIRSYYIKSSFSSDGEHLHSEYVFNPES